MTVLILFVWLTVSFHVCLSLRLCLVSVTGSEHLGLVSVSSSYVSFPSLAVSFHVCFLVVAVGLVVS